jgi:hypothetical protein
MFCVDLGIRKISAKCKKSDEQVNTTMVLFGGGGVNAAKGHCSHRLLVDATQRETYQENTSAQKV